MGQSFTSCCRSRPRISVDDIVGKEKVSDTESEEEAAGSEEEKEGMTVAEPSHCWSDEQHEKLVPYLQRHFQDLDEENVMDDNDEYLDVDVFMDLYKTALYWNRILFQAEQDSIIEKRRELMKAQGINSLYKEVCIYLDQRGERYMADILDQILYRSDKDHTLFEKSLIHYMSNDITLALIQKLKEAAQDGILTLPDLKPHEKPDEPARDSEGLRSKKELMATHRKLHALTIEHMKHLKTLPEQQLPFDLAVLTHVLQDKLFIAVGVDTDMLDAATDECRLEEDEEYKQMIAEYSEQVSAIKLGQVHRMPAAQEPVQVIGVQ